MTDITHTNERFKILSKSSDFLNIILDNINSCVMLLDNELKLRAFNNPLTTIFSNKRGTDILYRRCGEAIGCAHQIEENKACGSTSYCSQCELRMASLYSYIENKPVENKHLIKSFIDHNGIKSDKHLQFSTRLFIYNKEKYIVVIIDDITELKMLEMEKVD